MDNIQDFTKTKIQKKSKKAEPTELHTGFSVYDEKRLGYCLEWTVDAKPEKVVDKTYGKGSWECWNHRIKKALNILTKNTHSLYA